MVTIIIFLRLSSHLSSTHCFGFFTYWERESITEVTWTSKDPSHKGGFADHFCRCPSLGAINKYYYLFKILSILGYYIRYLFFFLLFWSTYIFLLHFFIVLSFHIWSVSIHKFLLGSLVTSDINEIFLVYLPRNFILTLARGQTSKNFSSSTTNSHPIHICTKKIKGG